MASNQYVSMDLRRDNCKELCLGRDIVSGAHVMDILKKHLYWHLI